MSLLPTLASADEPSLTDWARARVQDGLVKPLSDQEGGFSRGARPPQERRVRVLQSTVTTDKSGNGFLSFAIDARYGSNWRNDTVRGCVYAGSGKLFVKIGEEYRPAEFLFGQYDAAAVPGVCEAPAKS